MLLDVFKNKPNSSKNRVLNKINSNEAQLLSYFENRFISCRCLGNHLPIILDCV